MHRSANTQSLRSPLLTLASWTAPALSRGSMGLQRDSRRPWKADPFLHQFISVCMIHVLAGMGGSIFTAIVLGKTAQPSPTAMLLTRPH